jgi:membrane-bound metal-dependent hydrolase YbcI (DUF457 family)
VSELQTVDCDVLVIGGYHRILHRLTSAFQDWLGPDSVKNCRPLLGIEDFSRFGQVEPPLPVTLFFLGITQLDSLSN